MYKKIFSELLFNVFQIAENACIHQVVVELQYKPADQFLICCGFQFNVAKAFFFLQFCLDCRLINLL